VQGSSELTAALVMMAVGLVLVWLLSFAAPGHNEVTETDE
jgi:putative membrane protein